MITEQKLKDKWLPVYLKQDKIPEWLIKEFKADLHRLATTLNSNLKTKSHESRKMEKTV